MVLAWSECRTRLTNQIFGDKNMTIDKFLEENGEIVRRGALGPDGDIEIWNDRTEAVGEKYLNPKPTQAEP